jgi:hypothetical protein
MNSPFLRPIPPPGQARRLRQEVVNTSPSSTGATLPGHQWRQSDTVNCIKRIEALQKKVAFRTGGDNTGWGYRHEAASLRRGSRWMKVIIFPRKEIPLSPLLPSIMIITGTASGLLMNKKKKKPKIKVLDWPAIPVPTPEEVYGLTPDEKAKIERELKKGKSGKEEKGSS